MNSEYAVGKIHIHFESRARRRRLVALFYAAVAGLSSLGYFAHENTGTVVWIAIGCGLLFSALFLVFTWIAGDMRTHGDERELHRRDHAHCLAYRAILCVFAAAFFYSAGLRMQIPNPLLVAAFLLFVTLPQAILLWTEPEMEDPQKAG